MPEHMTKAASVSHA